MKYAVVAGLLAISTAAAAPPKPAKPPKLEPDDLPGPQPEVAPEVMKNPSKIDLPAVPAFVLPATEPGFHTPRELRVHGRPVLGTEIKLKGYITWIYDCAVAVAAANPRATRAQIQVAIATDATLCERPKFYLGDAKTTSRDASVWVVDVPRAPTKQERDRLPKDELKAWPAVPKLALGDYVVVTGTWAIQSPHAEHNTDGLLVYKALAPAQPAAPGAAVAPAPPPPEPEIAVITKIPLRRPIDDKVRNTSVDHLNACNKAIAARQYDAGIAECQAATKAWPDNHLAWYAWASAHMAKGEWTAARDAVQHAVALRPDQGMYQLYHGISLYEAEQQQAAAVNPTALDPARDALLRATKLAPDLWRAHYYLGRVYRDRDDAKHAAEQFAATIKTHPSYRFGYIALVELYRKWDYIDEALAVAMLGTSNVAAAEASELWFEVGMAYDARHSDDKAIDAFGKAIAGKPDDAGSKFQRGQIYFRKGDLANAKADLEAVVASPDPRIASAKPVARQILAQIATKH